MSTSVLVPRRDRGAGAAGREGLRGDRWRSVVGGRWGLFDQPLGYVSVGDLYLLVTGAGVGELLARVGHVQILPDGRHFFGNVETSVLLGHHLQGRSDQNENVLTLNVSVFISLHWFKISI